MNKVRPDRCPVLVNKVDNKKAAMIMALKELMGNVSKACEHVGISRTLHYDWMREDKDYALQYEHIGEATTDFVESKLLESINGPKYQVITKSGEIEELRAPPNTQAQIFYLKTKGRKRGYQEKIEIDHTVNSLENITFVIKGK